MAPLHIFSHCPNPPAPREQKSSYANLPTAPQTPDTPTFSADLSLHPPAHLRGYFQFARWLWSSSGWVCRPQGWDTHLQTHSPNFVLPSSSTLKSSLHLPLFSLLFLTVIYIKLILFKLICGFCLLIEYWLMQGTSSKCGGKGQLDVVIMSCVGYNATE